MRSQRRRMLAFTLGKLAAATADHGRAAFRDLGHSATRATIGIPARANTKQSVKVMTILVPDKDA
ncbi:hypothetical protein [Pseudarthrobacter sulfonivorans]|uniref:hypothetical protein n=1 Tax=Pseudarthrobacter sulfonivorans TaxID=121292 RepID=UPI002864CD04|nr:hypothetical protein [Pseudarthrobacter sulfonivorans]MDR6417534.1 hypothetical protein [Pseudarthrobacter sulfonivorans]